ncbi:MAG TPA: ArsR family transcriptional regulator [Bacteroidetes bacterium]|nr:ArsR family transcriptional regulator [Bacteroidota bacterium]
MRNEQINFDNKIEILSRFSKALGHPVRIKIFKYLESNSYCYVKDIQKILPLAQSTVSQHLKELKKAGLIKAETEATKTKYSIDWSKWQYAKALFNNIFR